MSRKVLFRRLITAGMPRSGPLTSIFDPNVLSMALQALGKPHGNHIGPHTLQIVHSPRPAALLALFEA